MSSRPDESIPRTQRLFFALWPDTDVRDALGRQLAGTVLEKPYRRAKRVPTANLHMTLAFPGQVTAIQRACLEMAADSVSGAPFTLVIDHVDRWPGPRVLWSGPTRTPPALWSLAGVLRKSLSACGIQQEKQLFRPHITLARKVERTGEAIKISPVEWRIKRFVLVESRTQSSESIYTVLRTWMLEGE
jgi:2'-5' RNA ligase